MANATLTMSQWKKYRDILSQLSSTAAEEFRHAVWDVNGFFGGVGLQAIPRDQLISYAYALVTKYSEGATAAACEMYDAIAALSGVPVPLAVPANTATVADISKTLNGVINVSDNPELVSQALGRWVKMAGQDTTLQNALRDQAQVAWIPAGLTCAFCVTLASNGWRTVSQGYLKGGHATHIHPNCDCAYAVRFNEETEVGDYDNGKKYLKMYEDAPLDKWNTKNGKPPEGHEGAERPSSKNRINAMRRKMYAEMKEKEGKT